MVVEWLVHHPSALLERGFTSRPQIWPGLARLLNEIEILLDGFDGAELLDYPLPEEYDLQAGCPRNNEDKYLNLTIFRMYTFSFYIRSCTRYLNSIFFLKVLFRLLLIVFDVI